MSRTVGHLNRSRFRNTSSLNIVQFSKSLGNKVTISTRIEQGQGLDNFVIDSQGNREVERRENTGSGCRTQIEARNGRQVVRADQFFDFLGQLKAR